MLAILFSVLALSVPGSVLAAQDTDRELRVEIRPPRTVVALEAGTRFGVVLGSLSQGMPRFLTAILEDGWIVLKVPARFCDQRTVRLYLVQGLADRDEVGKFWDEPYEWRWGSLDLRLDPGARLRMNARWPRSSSSSDRSTGRSTTGTGCVPSRCPPTSRGRSEAGRWISPGFLRRPWPRTGT